MDNFKLKAHLFVCTNSKKEGRSCGSLGAQELRDVVKKNIGIILGEHGLANANLRINASGCLGHCENGIVAVCYPSGTWLTQLKKTDSSELIELVKKELSLASK